MVQAIFPAARERQQLPTCRACGGNRLTEILSLGKTPLANALLDKEQLDQPEPTYPLELAFCSKCALVQITETVPPETLFHNYAYFSSFSDTMLEHARSLTGKLREQRRLHGQSLVVEVASNDGYLLKFYQQAGVPVLGIEPAVNIAHVAQSQHGIPTLCEFFGDSLARQLVTAGKRADVIHANNVLAHVPDLNGFIAGVKMLLQPSGVAVVEVPYVKDLIDHVEFDTIYHEHLCYFSLTAVDRLVRRHDLQILDVERLEIHGGSLRIYMGHPGRVESAVAVQELLQSESTWVENLSFYESFGARVVRLREELTGLLRKLKSEHKRIAVYGASAKGSTLLNYFGIGNETLDYVVDRSTIKQGRFTPGTHLKIHAPERLLDDQPDYVLLLTWNFAKEILDQQAEYRQLGGRFIIPIPEVQVA